jgi:uncharacterized glyoxalase superfamily protein PhnB
MKEIVPSQQETQMTRVELQGSGIAPSMTVNDLNRSIKFYTEGLGFSIESRNEVEGVLRFVMLKAGDSRLGLGQDDFAKGKNRSKGIGMRLRINTTQDLQSLADQVKAAGFTLDSDVAPLPWGALAFAVKDPDGFQITISHPRS